MRPSRRAWTGAPATPPSAKARAPAALAAYRMLRSALGVRPSRKSLGNVPATTSPMGC